MSATGQWVIDRERNRAVYVAGPYGEVAFGQFSQRPVEVVEGANAALVALIERGEPLPTMTGPEISEAASAGKRVEWWDAATQEWCGSEVSADDLHVWAGEVSGASVVARVVEPATREVRADEVKVGMRVVPGGWMARKGGDEVTAADHIKDMEDGRLLAVQLIGPSLGRWDVAPDRLVTVLAAPSGSTEQQERRDGM